MTDETTEASEVEVYGCDDCGAVVALETAHRFRELGAAFCCKCCGCEGCES